MSTTTDELGPEPEPDLTIADLLRAGRGLADVDPCPGYGRHLPSPLRLVTHHVIPLGWGGLDVASNRVRCCDVCHYATHVVLDVFRRAGTPMSRAQVRVALSLPRGRGLSRWSYVTARQGWDGWERLGRPPQRSIHSLFGELEHDDGGDA